MSLTSKTFFVLSCTTTVSIIAYVHYKQQYDKEQLHFGVVRDQENQARRKRENLYLLESQAKLAAELRKAEKEREMS